MAKACKDMADRYGLTDKERNEIYIASIEEFDVVREYYNI